MYCLWLDKYCLVFLAMTTKSIVLNRLVGAPVQTAVMSSGNPTLRLTLTDCVLGNLS